MRSVSFLVLFVAAVLTGCLSLMTSSAPKVGMSAPGIVGANAKGEEFRLQEYKGKVVLLSFWHSHCPPCRAMFRHEKAMVSRYQGKPFALLGVNADSTKEELQATQEKSGLTWKSWWDGSQGPIAAIWGVDRYPSFFLLDKQGVIRFHHTGMPPEGLIESKIEQLLQESSAIN